MPIILGLVALSGSSQYVIGGAFIRWTIRPGTEPQLGRCSVALPLQSVQFLNSMVGLSQLIHCVLYS